MNKKDFDSFLKHTKCIQNNEVHIRINREGNIRKFYWIKQEVILLKVHKRENAYKQEEVNKLVERVKKLEKEIAEQ